MNPENSHGPARILIVDDNPSIHRDFKLVLLDELPDSQLEAEEERLFAGQSQRRPSKALFILDDAFSGHEAIEKLEQSLKEERPYQLAFVDIRMPGIDGVETIRRLWALDDRLQVVICTAYSDYSWSDLAERLGPTDKLLVLKKPFDTIEVIQLASTLTEKWRLSVQANLKLEEMELLVAKRTQKLLDLLRQQETEPAAADHQVRTSPSESTSDSCSEAEPLAEMPVILFAGRNGLLGAALSEGLSSDYKSISCERTEDAFAMARDTLPDIIIAEASSLRPGAIQLCQQLKADELAGHIPVLLVAPRGEDHVHLQALEAGADDCAPGPVTLELLRGRIERLLENRQRSVELPVTKGLLQPREISSNQVDAQFLRRAINTAERFLCDFEFDVDVFARKMAMSRRQLFRKLKAVAGCTPNLFIRSLRLNRAAHLLLHSQMTVTEITYAVGFSDLKHFRSLFKDSFGVLPGEYTAQHSPAKCVIGDLNHEGR